MGRKKKNSDVSIPPPWILNSRPLNRYVFQNMTFNYTIDVIFQSIADNDIGPEGFQAIAEMLQESRQITSLNISGIVLCQQV